MVNPNVMSFKLNLNPAASCVLPSVRVISVQGRDSAGFLQAQLMNDVTALANSQWQYTGWLNAQGRVMALFQLVKQSDDQFLIILCSLSPDWLIDNLKRFVFRSKVEFSIMPNVYASGEILAAIDVPSANQDVLGDIESQLSINMPNPFCMRRMHLSRTPANADADALNQWHCIDMTIGWPWIDSALQNFWTPQMLSLQTLNAFSLKKGCYPGQEIVARTHYLGKSKRHLVRIGGNNLIDAQSLFQNDLEIGKVVNANQPGDFAIAVLPIDLAQNTDIQNTFGKIEIIA